MEIRKYPSNSHKDREVKKVEKITKGIVIQKKKSFGKQFFENFINDDMNSVSSYIVHDVLIPALKSAVTEMIQGGLEMMLYGERKNSRSIRDGGRSYTSYNNYSQPSNRREISSRQRSLHNFDGIILSSRQEAEDVLGHMVDLVVDYGQATVSDLYDLVGITSNFTDNKYGWTDLRSSSVSRGRDGYLLNLPKPILLD